MLGVITHGHAETNQPLVKIWRVRDEGRVVYGPGITNLVRGGKLTLPAPGRLEFSFAPLDEATEQPVRLRY